MPFRQIPSLPDVIFIEKLKENQHFLQTSFFSFRIPVESHLGPYESLLVTPWPPAEAVLGSLESLLQRLGVSWRRWEPSLVPQFVVLAPPPWGRQATLCVWDALLGSLELLLGHPGLLLHALEASQGH